MKPWNSVRTFLLSGICAISLLYPHEAEGARKKSRQQERRSEKIERKVPEKKPQKQGDVPTLEEHLSPAQVERKIATIRQRIAHNGKISGRDKAILLSVFDDVSQTERGRWILEKAHPDLNFCVKDLGAGCNGVYVHGLRTIELSNRILDQIARAKDRYEQIQKKLYLAHVIAHEATHSVQDTNKMDYAEGISFAEKITINKVCELNSILNENIVRFQVGNLPKYRADIESGKVMLVPMHLFYRDLRTAKLAEGADKATAARFARTKFVEAFWSNQGGPIYVGNKKVIPPGEVMRNWNGSYNIVSFGDHRAWKDRGQNKGITNVLQRYIDVMKIDTPPSFFTNPETTSFRLSSTQRLEGYTDGIKGIEIDALAVGDLIKVYEKGQPVRFRFRVNDSKAAAQGKHTETFDETGSVRSTYTCVSGKVNGIYREFDKRGRQIIEMPVRNNIPEGDGWLFENGKRIKIKFRNEFVVRERE